MRLSDSSGSVVVKSAHTRIYPRIKYVDSQLYSAGENCTIKTMMSRLGILKPTYFLEEERLTGFQIERSRKLPTLSVATCGASKSNSDKPFSHS